MGPNRRVTSMVLGLMTIVGRRASDGRSSIYMEVVALAIGADRPSQRSLLGSNCMECGPGAAWRTSSSQPRQCKASMLRTARSPLSNTKRDRQYPSCRNGRCVHGSDIVVVLFSTSDKCDILQSYPQIIAQPKHLSIERPEYNPQEPEGLDQGRAIRLYEIAGNAGDLLGDFLAQHPEAMNRYPELAMIASQIAGTVFHESCEVFGIPEDIISRVSRGEA